MDDEQFDKLISLNEATARSIEDVSKEQVKQGEKLEDVNATVSGMDTRVKVDMAEMNATVRHIKERAAEDRIRADKKESELEGKVGLVHTRVGESNTKVDRLRGEHDNHVKDNHATIAAETKTALNAHVKDVNRHSGEAPGINGKIKTAGLAAGGGGLIWGALELFKALMGDGS